MTNYVTKPIPAEKPAVTHVGPLSRAEHFSPGVAQPHDQPYGPAGEGRVQDDVRRRRGPLHH